MCPAKTCLHPTYKGIVIRKYRRRERDRHKGLMIKEGLLRANDSIAGYWCIVAE